MESATAVVQTAPLFTQGETGAPTMLRPLSQKTAGGRGGREVPVRSVRALAQVQGGECQAEGLAQS